MKLKTSFLAFLFNYILIVLCILAILLINHYYKPSFSRIDLPLIIMLAITIALFFLVDEIVYRRLFTYEIDENGIKQSFKLFSKKEIFIPYQNVSGVKLEKNLIERILKIGSIYIESSTEKIMIKGIKNPENAYKEILEKIKK